MSAHTDGTRTLTSLEDIRGYFSKASAIVAHLVAVNARERRLGIRNDGTPEILAEYIGRLHSTMRALAMKYGFAAFFADRLPSDFEIASSGSGLPTATEIRRMEADEAAARQVRPSGDLREEMLDQIFRHKQPPRELQFEQSQEAYRSILRSEMLFGSRIEPTLVEIQPGQSGLRRWLVHWGCWDAERHQPLVYILIMEDSGAPRSTLSDPERIEAFKRACLGTSQSSLKLLTVATTLDDDFASLHPKSLKRFVIGPLQSRRYTEVSEDAEQALAHVQGDWKLDWVFSWTAEEVRSLGTRRNRVGLFGERLSEAFDIDLKSHTSVSTGTTDTATKHLLPYEVFQTLNHLPGNRLMEGQKFVVAPDGHIASHL